MQNKTTFFCMALAGILGFGHWNAAGNRIAGDY
jgi:hypothetical protein